MLKLDNAGIGTGFAFPFADDRGAGADGIAMKDRLGEINVGHAEVGDGGAQGGIAHRHANQQPQGKDAVYQPFPEFGVFGELRIQMEGLGVHGKGRKKGVVHFSDGSARLMLELLPLEKILEKKTGQLKILLMGNYFD